MKRYLFILATFLASCTANKTSTSMIIESGQALELRQFGFLYDDDLYVLEVHYPDTLATIINREQLSVDQLLSLHEIGANDTQIINIIKYTKSIFILSADDVVFLQLKGVSLTLINYLIEM